MLEAQIKNIKLRGRLKFDEPLKKHTSFRIGGPARIWFEPLDKKDLVDFVKFLHKKKKKFFVIGAGSNILVNDKGLKTVVSLSGDSFKSLTRNKSYITSGPGVWLNRLVSFSSSHGLSGIEFLYGIPATLGGAIFMNAGVRERVNNSFNYKSIGDFVHELEVMDRTGKVKIFKRKDLNFKYRHSNLSRYIILKVKLKLLNKTKEDIAKKIREFCEYRKAHLDLSGASAGCIFKNPLDKSAGKLIDLCGFKNRRVGGAYVSARHANFIMNDGTADAKDVLALIDLIKNKVKEEFGICLKPEIKIVC